MDGVLSPLSSAYIPMIFVQLCWCVVLYSQHVVMLTIFVLGLSG